MGNRLPTDRNGNLYYGPSTYAEVEAQAEHIREDYYDDRITVAEARAKCRRLHTMLIAAGYTGLAARFKAAGYLQ